MLQNLFSSVGNSNQAKSEDEYQCGACKSRFNAVVDFGKHFPIAHQVFHQIPCGVCGAKFNKLPLLLRHEQQHRTHPDKKITFPCRVCSKIFNGYRNVRHHMLSCHKDHVSRGSPEQRNKRPVPVSSPSPQENYHKCKNCLMIFYKLSDLSEHSVEHVSNQCGVCGQNFTLRAALKKHLAFQHPDFKELRLFPCPVCGKEFKSKQTMRVNLLKLPIFIS